MALNKNSMRIGSIKSRFKQAGMGLKNFSQRNKYENLTQSFPSKIPAQHSDFQKSMSDYLQGFRDGRATAPGIGRLFSPNDRATFALIDKLKPLEAITELDSKEMMAILTIENQQEREEKLKAKVTAIVKLVNAAVDNTFAEWKDIPSLQDRLTSGGGHAYEKFSADNVKEEMARSYLMAVTGNKTFLDALAAYAGTDLKKMKVAQEFMGNNVTLVRDINKELKAAEKHARTPKHIEIGKHRTPKIEIGKHRAPKTEKPMTNWNPEKTSRAPKQTAMSKHRIKKPAVPSREGRPKLSTKVAEQTRKYEQQLHSEKKPVKKSPPPAPRRTGHVAGMVKKFSETAAVSVSKTGMFKHKEEPAHKKAATVKISDHRSKRGR